MLITDNQKTIKSFFRQISTPVVNRFNRIATCMLLILIGILAIVIYTFYQIADKILGIIYGSKICD